MKTQYSRRDLYAMGEPLGESVTRMEAGRRVYGGGGGIGGIVGGVADAVGDVASSVGNAFSGGGGGGGGSAPAAPASGAAFSQATPAASNTPSVSPMSQIDQQQGIAGYAQPYVNTMLGATMQNLFNYDQYGNALGLKGYTPYSMNATDYVAGFSPLQEQAQRGVAGMQVPGQYQAASDAAQRAIQQAQGATYTPIAAGYSNVNAPSLQQYQMGPAERVGSQNFNQPGVAGSYMSPYMQNVVDVQQQQAKRQAAIQNQAQAAQAAQLGAFGGGRDVIQRAQANAELQRNLQGIQASGLQNAYQQAQQQFNADQARRMQASLANQQAGLTTGQANLQALLGTQQLGAGQNLQAQLANQQAGLTTGQQNLAARLGVQQLGAQQGLQAQLANQQAQQQANQLAAQQQQFGANYGLQNLQQQLAGAGLLGNLGTSQLAAQQGIFGLQNQMGQQQQQQQQNIINQAVQNYQTAQQYPIQQLGVMKSMLQGLPVTTTSQQNYMAAPTNMQNVAALGLGAYGLGNLMGGTGTGGSAAGLAGGGSGGLGSILNQGAGLIGSGLSKAGDFLSSGISSIGSAFGFQEGGQVHGYKQGGVTSEENVRSIADLLPTQQLPKSLQAATNRSDIDAEDALRAEMAERASLQRGLGSAFNQLPQSAQQNVIRAAGGGIIAFEEGGTAENDDKDETGVADLLPSKGNPKLQSMYGDKLLQVISRMEGQNAPASLTTAQRRAAEKQAFDELMANAGPAPYGDLKKTLESDEAARAETLQQGKGLAALAAMQGMLQPGGMMRGLGAAGSAFANSYSDALKADRAEKRYIAQMKFNLADAERKERMGLTKEARADVQASEQNKLNAYKAGIQRDQAIGNILGKGMQATRQVGGAGGAGKEKEWEFATKKYLPLVQSNPETKDLPLPQQEALAYDMYQKGKSPGYQGAAAKIESTDQKTAAERFDQAMLMRNSEVRKLQKAGDTAGVERIRQEEAVKVGYKLPGQTTKPTVATSGVTVTAGGKTYTFPDQNSADQFKAAAGIK